MTQTTAPISSKDTLAELAATRAGASRVFYRHGLDFCCHGRVSIEEACKKKQLDVQALVREIEEQVKLPNDFQDWDRRTTGELIAHILARFHEPHREELTRLLAMAKKVEAVHAEKASCPRGLAEHFEGMSEALLEHMQKEEQVLFPLLDSPRAAMARMPIQMMEEEHDDHGRALERLRQLTNGYTPPEDACGTWTALYLGLAELEQQLMEHIHTENNILFPRALRR